MNTSKARSCGLLAVLVLVSCSKPANEAAINQAESAPVAGPVHVAAVEPAQAFDAATARYTGFENMADPIQLQQGKWEGAPWNQGAAARPQITQLDGVEASGDLNHQAGMESIVLLNLAMGGTGQLLYLAAIPSDADSNSVISVTPVGDRVKVRAIEIINGLLMLEVLQAGPEDAMCCPGELATRAWEMNAAGELVEIDSSIEPQRFSVTTLAGSDWILNRWSQNEMAENTGISLGFVENGITGFSGCNRYNASMNDGKSPGEVSVGPAVTTRMACPGEQMLIETRYLKALAAVSKLGFVQQQLILTTVTEAGVTSMYFNAAKND